MEDTASFYITLPSNACKSFYPNNRLENYQVRLPYTVHFPLKYEVALAEIQYPRSWEMFAQAQSGRIQVYVPRTDDRRGYVFWVNIPPGFYDTMDELLEVINQLLNTALTEDAANHHAAFSNAVLEQRTLLQASDGVTLTVSEELADMLGFKMTELAGNIKGEHRHDMSRGFHSLYVYCSICEPQIVGDVKVPLLRTVALQGKRGEHVTITYTTLHYVPVSTPQMSTIELHIKDDTNQDVPFTSGKVVCKLHFRPKII